MAWSNLEISQDIKVNGAPAVASWKEGRLDVFVRATDNHLYHRTYEGGKWVGTTWTPITSPPFATLMSSPAAVSWGPNRIDLFAVWTTDTQPAKRLYHNAWNGNSWQAQWDDLDGGTNDVPAAASWKKERVDVFVRGADNNMSRRYWEVNRPGEMGSGWEPWKPLGAVLMSAPSAAASASDRIDCFGADNDGHVIHMLYDGKSDHSWEVLDGALKIKGAPAAASAVTVDKGRVDVFVCDGDDHLKHRVYFKDGWEEGNSWDEVSTQKIFSAPAAVAWWNANIPKRYDVFAQGADNKLFHTWWVG